MSTYATRLARATLLGSVGVGATIAAGCSAMCRLDARPPVGGPTPPRWEDRVEARPDAQPELPPARQGMPVWPRHEDPAAGPAEPRWGEEPQPPAAQAVNVFGEMDGAAREGDVRTVGASGFQQHTSVDEGEDSDVTVDPTGRWLAFTSTRHNEGGEIYLQRVDGTSVTQLTSDSARDAYPSFSPDGKWIAFSSTRAGNWQIYRMDLDGRNVVQVTSGPMQAIHPSFSPDGTRLVYSATGARSRQWELWTVNLLTGERRQIGYGLFPSWSPDKAADRIAYQRARQRGSRWFSLWTLDLVDGEGRRTTEVAVSSNAAIVTPCWSPDGRKLAFTTVVQSGRGQQDVWTVDADGANKRRLTDGNGTNLTPAWAADGRVYFVSDRSGNESIWSIGTEPVDTFTAEARKHAATKPVESADTKDTGH